MLIDAGPEDKKTPSGYSPVKEGGEAPKGRHGRPKHTPFPLWFVQFQQNITPEIEIQYMIPG